MTPNRTLLMMTSALAIACASPVMADLTAEQVLADQLRQMESYGLNAEVTNQSRSGDTLTVEGLSATITLPEGGFDMTIGGAMFTELGDGTVEVTYPREIPITMKGTSANGEKFDMVMSMTQTGTSTIVSGIPEEIRYEFKSDRFALESIRFNEPAEAAELDMDVAFSLIGLSGVMELAGGTIRDYTAQFAFDAIEGKISGAPEGEGAFDVFFFGKDMTAD